LSGQSIVANGHILSPAPGANGQDFLLPVRYVYCPDCGCSHLMHDAINKIGNELVPHCENCGGGCWRSVGTPFAVAVADRLKAIADR